MWKPTAASVVGTLRHEKSNRASVILRALLETVMVPIAELALFRKVTHLQIALWCTWIMYLLLLW